jgi:hypothetical protein
MPRAVAAEVHELGHTPARKKAADVYLDRMSFEFCIPTKSTTVPDAPDWLHEIKYDVYASGWSATATACA